MNALQLGIYVISCAIVLMCCFLAVELLFPRVHGWHRLFAALALAIALIFAGGAPWISNDKYLTIRIVNAK